MISSFTILRTIFLSLTIIMCGVLEGQQIPIFNQYVYHAKLYNPAAMGDGFIGLQYKMDYSKLDRSYAPQSFALVSDLSQVLNLSKNRIGFGVSVISDNAHIVNLLKAKASFAYHLVKNEKNRLSAGIEAGILSQKIDLSNTRISDPSDAIIYDGESNKSVFDGGLGIQYRYFVGEGQEFNANITLPQLFTSDLIYDEGREFEISPHVLAGLSYRFPIGESFGLEPHVLYREVGGGKKLKKGILDLNLRGHFLNDRLWFGLGTRLGASSYNFGFGVQVVENFDIQGSFELHDVLGNSWEVLLLYSFKEKVLPPSPPPPPPVDTKSYAAKLKLLQEETAKSTSGIPNLKKEIESNLKLAQIAYDESQYIGLGKEGIAAKLRKTNNPLAEARRGINQLLDIEIAADQNKQSAQQLFNEAREQGANSRKIDKYWTNTKNKSEDARKVVNGIVSDYSLLVDNIKKVEKKNELSTIDLKSMFAKNDLKGLEIHYQNELNEALGINEKTEPVEVSTDGFSVLMTYEFAHDRENFNLEKSINRSRFLADHIVEQINDLKSEGIEVESITIIAAMQARSSSLEKTPVMISYGEDFGYRVTIDYRFSDELEKTIEDTNITIQTGAINLKKLACLKLYGFKRYLSKNGIDTSFNLEMNAPNNDQNDSQVYSIVVKVKP